MQVIDSFMFCGEFDLLKIRLETIGHLIDKVIILESPRSHSGIPKELEYPKQKYLFEKFKHKIKYYSADYCIHKNGHENDFEGRELILRMARERCGLNDNSVLIHGDLDEVPNAKILEKILKSELNYPVTLMMDTRILTYDLQYNNPDGQFPGTMILKGWHIGDEKLYQFRRIRANPKVQGIQYNAFDLIPNAGWHFTYQDINRVADKMRYFCHSDECGDWIKTKEGLINCIKTRTGFTPDKPKFELVEWKKENFPSYIFENPSLFKENLSYNY